LSEANSDLVELFALHQQLEPFFARRCNLEETKAKRIYEKAVTEIEWNRTVLLFTSFVVLTVTVSITVVISRRIMGDLLQFQVRLKKIASGEADLTSAIDKVDHRELQEMARHFNLFRDKLHQIITSAKEISNTVAGSTHAITVTSKELAVSSEQQSAELVNIAQVMDRLSHGLSRVADAATAVNQKAQESVKQAGEGTEYVKTMSECMTMVIAKQQSTIEKVDKIVERSKKIFQVISFIEQMAKRTRLIALNASIGAAKSQGLSMTVVEEMRSLAEETGRSALQINELLKDVYRLIQDINEESTLTNVSISELYGLVQLTEGNFSTIYSSLFGVKEMFTGIFDLVNEQNAIIQRVTLSTQAISTASIQSVNGIGELSESTNELSAKTETLKNALAKFVVNESTGSGVHRRRSVVTREEALVA
jgi:methyl-accepting chemotaxis protein